MHTFCFLRTKPRLSQAGALLLPKDFVSLSISSLLWQRYIFVLTIPTKPFFFLKELMRILQKTIRCAWLTPWLRAWILKVSESCIRNAGAALTTPEWCSPWKRHCQWKERRRHEGSGRLFHHGKKWKQQKSCVCGGGRLNPHAGLWSVQAYGSQPDYLCSSKGAGK